MKQTIVAAGRYAHIAMAVEHEESVVLLHRVTPTRRRRCHRDVEQRLRLRLKHVSPEPRSLFGGV
jgi:hypothetical protein